jgi:hypothetical protein
MMTIAEANELDMSIFEDTPNSRKGHLLVHAPASEFWFVGLEADVDTNGVTFTDELVTVLKIREICCGISLGQLRLDFLVPSIAVLLLVSLIFNLLIRKFAVFK